MHARELFVALRAAIALAGALCCACEGSTSKPGKPDAGELQPASPVRPHPPWFDAAKIPHRAVIMQIGPDESGYWSAMQLGLEPGVSNHECIERAKAALSESLSELPETIDGGTHLLLLEGGIDDYRYTIMCTDARGGPTMHLSYTDDLAPPLDPNRWSKHGGQ